MRFILLVAALLLVVPAAPATAVVPSTMSHQGVLTDNLGNLVPNGNYTLRFRIYTVSVGGIPLYLETHPAVPVQLGGYSVVIGSIAPLNLPFDVPYWLGVQVGADPELAPRIPLTASPYGLSLRLPFSGTASTAGASLSIGNTGSGPAIQALGRLDAGSSTTTGDFNLFEGGQATPIVDIYSNGPSGGGRYQARHAGGSIHTFIEEDVSGTDGGFLLVRAETGLGFQVDGNYVGTGDPRVTIGGSAATSTFDMSTTGDASVVLPSDAVASTEILDEPGVAAEASNAGITLDGTVQTLLSRTITVPAAGYVLVMGTAQGNALHVNGTTDNVSFGVSDVAGSLPVNQDVGLLVDDAYPTGNLIVPVTVHGLFSVGAGAHTFHFIGLEFSGSVSVNDLQLTCVYIPTAYGPVVPTIPSLAATSVDDELRGPYRGGLTASEIEAERIEAEAFDRARLLKELQAMQAQMDVLRRQVEQAGIEQASASNR